MPQKRTTCSKKKLGTGQNKPADYFTHYCTVVEQRFTLEHLGGADATDAAAAAASPQRNLSGPVNITTTSELPVLFLQNRINSLKDSSLRFHSSSVAPTPSNPVKCGRLDDNDSSNAIFVTPSWVSLSPLLLLFILILPLPLLRPTRAAGSAQMNGGTSSSQDQHFHTQTCHCQTLIQHHRQRHGAEQV